MIVDLLNPFTSSSDKQTTEMCNLFDLPDTCSSTRGLKRKGTACDLDELPPKRVSPFLNTPKEQRDHKKKILRLSIQKIKSIDNAELCLRKSVLINNTMKRLHSELKKDKRSHTRTPFDFADTVRTVSPMDGLSNSCLSNSFLMDDPFLSGDDDKITDDMTDTLVVNLENALGISISSISCVKEEQNKYDSIQYSSPDSGNSAYPEQRVAMQSCSFNDCLTSCSSKLRHVTRMCENSDSDSFVSGALQICVSVT